MRKSEGKVVYEFSGEMDETGGNRYRILEDEDGLLTLETSFLIRITGMPESEGKWCDVSCPSIALKQILTLAGVNS